MRDGSVGLVPDADRPTVRGLRRGRCGLRPAASRLPAGGRVGARAGVGQRRRGRRGGHGQAHQGVAGARSSRRRRRAVRGHAREPHAIRAGSAGGRRDRGGHRPRCGLCRRGDVCPGLALDRRGGRGTGGRASAACRGHVGDGVEHVRHRDSVDDRPRAGHARESACVAPRACRWGRRAGAWRTLRAAPPGGRAVDRHRAARRPAPAGADPVLLPRGHAAGARRSTTPWHRRSRCTSPAPPRTPTSR